MYILSSMNLSSRVEAFAQLLTLIFIFIIVLAAAYFATKFMAGYQKSKEAYSNIKVLDSLKISQTKYIQIVRVADKCFAIAVAKDSITYLGEIDEDSLMVFDKTKTNLPFTKSDESFNNILDRFKASAQPVDEKKTRDEGKNGSSQE